MTPRLRSTYLKRTAAPLMLLGVLLVGGCAYYNTYFNAQSAYDEAEQQRKKRQISTGRTRTTGMGASTENRPSAAERARSRMSGSRGRTRATGYEAAIEKAAKVIKYYPESKWVDDALLLMAKSYFRTNDFGRALRKTNELFTSFPESELLPEAHYWRGMCLWQLDQREEAREVLAGIVEDEGSGFRGDAAFALAEMAAEDEMLDRAAQYYQVAVRAAEDPLFRYRARKALGDQLMEAGRPEEAADVYRGLLDDARTNEARYDVLLRIVEAERQSADYDRAIEVLDELLEDDRYYEELENTKIELARTLAAKGEIERAILLYQEVVEAGEDERYNRTTEETIVSYTREAQKAHYYLGKLQQDHFGNLSRAAFHYDIASGSRGGVSDSAAAELKALERWEELHEALRDTSDSVSTALPRHESAFALADLFLFQLDNVDSALAYYRFVTDSFPSEDLAQRATYALGWLWLTERSDTTIADSVWNPLVTDTTGTLLVRELQGSIRRAKGLEASPDPALEPFAQAESLWRGALRDRPATVPPRLAAAGAPTVLTPHIGSAVEGVRREIERAAATAILDALSGRAPGGRVAGPERRC